MHLALGDVVRDRTHMVIGTVARIDTNETNETRRVVVSVPGSVPRPVAVGDLEIVRRYSHPPTSRLRLMAVFFLLVALLAAYIAGSAVRTLGGNWPLTVLAGLGAFNFFQSGFRWYRRLTGPRRYRV